MKIAVSVAGGSYPMTRTWFLPLENTQAFPEHGEQQFGTHQAYPRDACVAQLVAAQATLTPEAVAVADDASVLTYQALDTRANKLAHHLRSLGVGPDVVVGLYLERSLALVVGALGILKADGAYLLLDPAYPPDRVAFMLKDASAHVLVTRQSLSERLPPGCCPLVSLDTDAPKIANYPSDPPPSQVEVGHLAYVVYTSGSTGWPKGVAISHNSLLNLVFWHRRTFGVKPTDRASQLAGPGFDASVWELWPYLTAGASLHLPTESIRKEPESLRDWLVAQRITISFVPTPLAERMIALRWPPETELRTLLTGSDTLHHYPSPNLPFMLVNNYGPSECAVVATSGPVLPDEGPAPLPPIGRPIANAEIYILDKDLKRVPIGTAGELHIGGAGVGRGYVNRPELTGERFIPHPFSKIPGTRLYKTGDLARYLPDGQITFLGRIDEQIKVRGVRIEPNEIVAILDTHPEIRNSAVVAREGALGDNRLVAYVVPMPNSHLTDTALREFLQERLPDYMVPAVFVSLEGLPVNSNGKVHRADLPPPNAANMLRDDIFMLPRTPIEEKFAGIVAHLLGLEKVSVEDNFFLLGGHSLLGTQLIARVWDTFGVELPLRSIFDAPTVAELAALVKRTIIARVQAMSEEEARVLGIAEPCRQT